jgi:hypothetical protein
MEPMKDVEEHGRNMIAIARRVLFERMAEARPEVQCRLEVARWNEASGRQSSELRMHFYYGDHLEDALELSLVIDGKPAGTCEEAEAWLRTHISDIVATLNML